MNQYKFKQDLAMAYFPDNSKETLRPRNPFQQTHPRRPPNHRQP